MKKRFLGLISVATLGICLASCNYVDIRTKKIVNISLQDSVSAYAVGQKYMDRCNLTIMATYFGSTDPVPLDKNEVSYFLTYNSNTYDVKSAFTTAGNYYLTVQKNGVNSNPIPVKVLASEAYVSSISVDGTGSNEVEENKYINLSLNVTPSEYTVDIDYVNNSPSLIDVRKQSNTSYRIKGLTTGSASITFKAKNSATTYVSTNYKIEVIPSTKTEIKQTYNDFIKHCAYTKSSCPLEGDAKILVIPVWFTDSSSYIVESYKNYIRQDIYNAYFGDESATGWESVASFYKKESNNTLNLTGTVSEWYNSTLSSMTVAAYDTNTRTGQALQGNLVKAATNWYFNNHSESRTSYDSDGDGYIDSVMLIYGAPNYYDYIGYTGDNMWAYCCWVAESSQKSLSNPGVNVYFWASYDFMYSKDKATARTGRSYGYGDTSHCNIDTHTYIHEMGHVFGLEDYYDYNFVKEGGSNTNPAAGFSMQDNNVGSHDPFSMMAIGWADPYIPVSSSTIIINDFQSSRDVILLSNNWNSNYDSPFDEYILLELYSNTGLNKFDCDYRYRGNYAQGPQDVGVRVWHVDARLLRYNGDNNTNFTSTPDVKGTNNLLGAFNNTSSASASSSSAYEYLHNEEYQTINLLQLIRNSTTKTYTDRGDLSSSDLFKAGSSFSMSTFNKQFVKGNKLDNGTDLGWSFSVNSILNNGDGTYSAEIQLVKA